ncbi:MAG: hypothetical protein BMS9Abin13_168 [Patescibacteria group bacterium]|nr:MAG: hypothetical protein BMS9Abin13_168 [Patescibacteria group bacterium]
MKMKTRFVLEKLTIPLPNGTQAIFWLDGNGKITVGNGTFEKPAPNAFSLVQVEDCPFATPICKSVCYVHRLEEAEQEVHHAYRENSRAIREILKYPAHQCAAQQALAAWIRTHCKYGFRWHVSGDIFSLQYARFIANVCNQAPHVLFWIYTRSFAYTEPLLEAPNLIVNLSADEDNLEKAYAYHRKYGFRICYMTVSGALPNDLPEGSVIFPSHELRGRDLSDPKQAPWWQSLTHHQRKMVCPPDFFGQSEKRRCGPCKKCLK